MPRRFIKRYMPDYATIRRQKCLYCLGTLLHDPALWHLNRHSVAGAFFVGLLIAFVPVPFQMLLAASMAIVVHVNIPISVALVWLTNPLTMPPMFYFAYKVGQWMLNLPDHDFDFELSWNWLSHGLSHIWQPFLLGCLVLGLASGILGYLSVRFAWRAYVIHKWRQRHCQAPTVRPHP
ncbi:MAG: DUF2062 domain-containing protein [Zetaproteobacteria bacterium]|nr:MAG: DUF2062 domain-containing protein [Zetaproteobacteria bacterium]